MNAKLITDYFAKLAEIIASATYTDSSGSDVAVEEAFSAVLGRFKSTAEAGNKVLFCGNGGSAGICSHMATDFFKNGGVKALALNDSSALTCLSNDYGYEFVFSKQIEMIADSGDLLVAISSSGNSENILNAVASARDKGCQVITLSGFEENNRLRRTGDINVYVSAQDYGFVESAHLAIITAMIDLHMGWPSIDYPT